MWTVWTTLRKATHFAKNRLLLEESPTLRRIVHFVIKNHLDFVKYRSLREESPIVNISLCPLQKKLQHCEEARLQTKRNYGERNFTYIFFRKVKKYSSHSFFIHWHCLIQRCFRLLHKYNINDAFSWTDEFIWIWCEFMVRNLPSSAPFQCIHFY